MDAETFNREILSRLEAWSHLGEQKNEMGTRLIGHVPQVAPKAYVHVIYAPLGEADSQEFVERLGRPVPRELQEFLGIANGLLLFLGKIRVMGYVPLKRRASRHIHNYPPTIMIPNVSARIKGLSQGEVVVASYEADGSYVSIEEDGTAVRFDAKGDGRVIQEWKNFDTWLISEVSNLNSSFKLPGDER